MMFLYSSSMVILLLLTLFSVGSLSVSNFAECINAPSEIRSLLSLEKSILCDEYNIQSLTEAFFPANTRQAFIVQVHFYVNRSEHPLQQPGVNTLIGPADYVFLWFSSSVLAFIEPRLLEGISLRTFVAEFNYAHLRIAPFFTDDEDWIRGLLSNATIWLKSYAVNRLATVSEGLDTSTQGFSTYNPNDTNSDDYFIENPPLLYQVYVFLLGASFASIVGLISVSFPFVIIEQYPLLHKLSKNEEKNDVKIKFRNLFWGLILALGCFVLTVFIFAVWHIHTFGLRWNTTYNFIYPLFIVGLIILHCIALVWAVVIVIIAIRNDNLICIPRLLYHIVGFDSRKPPVEGSPQRFILILWQGYGIFVIGLSVSLLAFFACGVLLALFVDPVQVITTIAIYAITLMCLAYAFGIVFEITDSFKKKNNSVASRSILYLKLFFIVFVLFLIMLFVIVFGYTYATIVFFAGSVDQIDLFSSIGELIPIVLASVIGWGLRYQLMTYYNQGKDNSVTTKSKPKGASSQDEIIDNDNDYSMKLKNEITTL